MAGYIGNIPVPQATQTRDSFTATSGQTSFATSGYTPNYLDVYLNGVKLASSDYTATNGSDVVLASGAAADDIIDVVAYSTFEVLSGFHLGDNDKAIFGTGSDLQIYHDGSNSYIAEVGTGDLIISAANDLILRDATDGTKMIHAVENAEVTLYHNGSGKISTTSTGIDVTGTVTFGDGHTLGNGVGDNAELTSSTGEGIVINSAEYVTTKTSGATRSLVSANGDISFYEDTGTTAKFFWDASAESLGIGTSSPNSAYGLHLYRDEPALVLQSANSSVGYINFADVADMNPGQISYSHTSDFMQFRVNDAERMRIDSSGNLLVGTTSSSIYNDTSGNGIQLNGGSGQVVIAKESTSSADPALWLNNTGVDGAIATFAKDGTAVGGIGTLSDYVYFFGQSYGIRSVASRIQPCTSTGANSDNIMDLGYSTVRWDDIYATNGTIQTSDKREKQDIDVLSDAEQRVAVAAKGLIRKFRWKDAVAEKGDDARIHFGVIAQDLKAAFEAEGLDAGRYAMFIHSEWWETYTDVPAVEAKDAVLDDDGNVIEEAVEAVDAYTRTDIYDTEAEAPEGAVKKDRMGVRYSELLAFIIGAL